MADKAVFPEDDIFADKAVRLDFAAGANTDVFLDLDKGPDKDVVTESATVQVAGFDHGDVAPGINVDNSRLAGVYGR
ncbi:hypothetical protein D3C79_951100 [compost metagenome]